jgi:hypothetical protein
MSDGVRIGSRQIGAPTILVVLAVIVAAVALLAPEAVNDAGNASTRSAAPDGARISYELAARMGWHVSRRDTPFEMVDGRSVQVVLAPRELLGAQEVHRLLDNVRHGGGLIFDVAGSESGIADSLGLSLGKLRSVHDGGRDSLCGGEGAGRVTRRPSTAVEIRARLYELTTRELKWRRPPPGVTTAVISATIPHASDTVGTAFPLGAGRVVAVASADVFHNDAIRACEFDIDLAVAQTLEYVEPADMAHATLVFDEFHHGYGAHGGSITAVARYLAHTASGHFLEQALLAALMLLMAYAPRDIAPRDPERMPRRSPLEHADALAHAYSDVEATRTATSRLVSGVRRRVGRIVSVSGAASDDAFLDAVARRTPTLTPSVEAVRRGLSETLTPRQFAAIANAILDIEQQLSTPPPKAS